MAVDDRAIDVDGVDAQPASAIEAAIVEANMTMRVRIGGLGPGRWAAQGYAARLNQTLS